MKEIKAEIRDSIVCMYECKLFACINEIVQCNYLIEVENACCFSDHMETNLYKYRDKNMNMNTQLCRHTYNIYIIYAFSEI